MDDEKGLMFMRCVKRRRREESGWKRRKERDEKREGASSLAVWSCPVSSLFPGLNFRPRLR